MREPELSPIEYEVLDTVIDSDETTAIILSDFRNPNNRDVTSPEAAALSHADLDAVFQRLAELGLVEGIEDSTDGFEHPRPGVTYTWWRATDEGRRLRARWDAAQPDSA